MSWTESEKLNEWIHRAYENGRAEEQERIIKLLENAFISDGESLASAKLYDLIALIKGENK